MEARRAPWSAAGSVSATPPFEGIPGGKECGIRPGLVARKCVAKAVSRLRLPPHSKAPVPQFTHGCKSPHLFERRYEFNFR